jgi:hypothetical protein
MVKSETRAGLVRVPVPIRDANGPTRGFSKTIPAAVNGTIAKAEVDRSMPNVVKNVKCEISKDGRSVTVSGEWTVTGDALAKAAGGGDLAVPVNVTQELRTTLSPGRHSVAGIMDGDSKIVVSLPPRPIGQSTRAISVDFGESTRDGQRRRIAYGTLDGNGVWQSENLTVRGQKLRVQAAVKDDKVQVTFIPSR